MSKTGVQVVPLLVVIKMPPEASGDQVVVGIVREDGDLGDAAGDESRADLARLERGESEFVDGLIRARPTTATAAATGSRRFILRDSGQGKTQKERE